MNLTKSDRVYNRHDQSSFSNPSLAISTSIHLDWTLDFEKQNITGSCKHSVTVVVSGTEDVDFDSSKLIIDSVTINNVRALFKVADADPQLGSKISVKIPEVKIRGSQNHCKLSDISVRADEMTRYLLSQFRVCALQERRSMYSFHTARARMQVRCNG